MPKRNRTVFFVWHFNVDYFTLQKYTDSPYSTVLHTDMPGPDVVVDGIPQDGTDLLWIVGPVCGAVVLILLVVLIIIFMR